MIAFPPSSCCRSLTFWFELKLRSLPNASLRRGMVQKMVANIEVVFATGFHIWVWEEKKQAWEI